jgi:hypothetical protein
MERSLETTVAQAVDAWLRWLPRWRPATTRGRTRLCRRCFGSPIIAAAGLDSDVPHAVQHALSTRMKTIIDGVVDEYTERNLPLLHQELLETERRKSAGYRPERGLDPEYEGLPLDPEPEPGEPYLFTLGELAGQSDGDVAPPTPRDLSEEEKQALRTELRLADECATHAGRLVCIALEEDRGRIRAGIERNVEPHVEALLADLTVHLDTPPSRWT